MFELFSAILVYAKLIKKLVNIELVIIEVQKSSA